MGEAVLLRMTGISKAFPGVQALDDVHLDAEAGSVHALMGENGAGKSTLMKVLAGIYRADSGRIELDGQEVASPGQRRGAPSRDRDDPPGAVAGPRDDGRGEHLPRARAREPLRAGRQEADDRRRPGGLRQVADRHQPAPGDEDAERRPDADGRDREGHLDGRPPDHHGRADLGHHRARGRAPPPDDPLAARERGRDHLHHAQDGRGVQDRGQGDRVPRRKARRDAARRRARPPEAHHADGRPRAHPPVPQGGGGDRRGGDVRPWPDPSRRARRHQLRSPSRRDPRPRRPHGRGTDRGPRGDLRRHQGRRRRDHDQRQARDDQVARGRHRGGDGPAHRGPQADRHHGRPVGPRQHDDREPQPVQPGRDPAQAPDGGRVHRPARCARDQDAVARRS